MNKAELIKTVADKSGVPQRTVAEVLDAVFDPAAGAIAEALSGGAAVGLRGFGTFEIRDAPPRLLRNPKTGEPVQVGAQRRPVWRPAAALKTRLNP